MADSNHSMLPPWGCSICLEESRDPVCTSCGHLFCWRCLYPWVHDMAKPCPVCRTPLNLDGSIIPVFATTQAEPAPQAAAIPPRPHPRVPASSTSAAATIRNPPRRAPTTSVPAPDHDPNAVHSWVRFHLETLDRVREQEAAERTRLAVEQERIVQIRNLVIADAWSVTCMRRELKHLRRRYQAFVVSSAGSGTTRQAYTTNSALSHGVLDMDMDMDIYRSHGTEEITRIVNAIVGRHHQ